MATRKGKKPTKKNEIVPQNVDLSTMPDFIDEGNNFDEVLDSDELLMPRIEVAQALSPQIDEDSENYIEGLKAGMLFNTVTGEIYGKKITFISVQYKKEYLLFQDRERGGGFGGSFQSMEEAQVAVSTKEGDGWEPQLALTNLIMILDKDFSTKEIALMSCSKTKIKIAKRMNTYLQMVRNVRYASVFELSTTKEDGAKGSYFNFAIKPLGWLPNRDTYEQAKQMADTLNKPQEVKEDVPF